MRVFFVSEPAVLVFNSFLKVFALFIGQSLELINGTLISTRGVVIASHFGSVESDFLLGRSLLIQCAK